MNESKVSIVIPAYKPDEALLHTVQELSVLGFDDIIVVDDGGGAEYKKYFDALSKRSDCTVLTHEKNRGKGAALKTAFGWYCENRDNAGVVTVDADGQHKCNDVVSVAQMMLEKDCVILGARNFKKAEVPLRSRFGNSFSAAVFRFLLAMKITDTQTGLRALPKKHLSRLCEVQGDRYEYETNVLLFLKRNALEYREVVIDTVYENDNGGSHFRPIIDSARIYKCVFRYIFTSTAVLFLASSMVCYLLDWAMFVAVNYFMGRVTDGSSTTTIAYAAARITSSPINFSLNRRIFKSSDTPVFATMVKYYMLVAFNILVGSMAIHFISKGLLYINAVERFCMRISEKSVATVLESIIKIPVDGMLYFCSYNVQKHIVFKK